MLSPDFSEDIPESVFLKNRSGISAAAASVRAAFKNHLHGKSVGICVIIGDTGLCNLILHPFHIAHALQNGCRISGICQCAVLCPLKINFHGA